MRGATFFYGTTEFFIEECYSCGIAFGMPKETQQNRKRDKKSFFCPNGHGQVYSRSAEQELREQIERKEQMLHAAELRAETAEKDRQLVTKAHKKMRERVMNGVCPCCNRTFQNLMLHMKSEHPDFSDVRTLLTLRTAFAMTQAQVAKEAGVDSSHVSLYERGHHVAGYAKTRLDAWLERHQATELPEPSTTASGNDEGSTAGRP